MADQNITNWDAVAKHLAIEVMGWHKGDIGKAEEYPGAYHDSKNNWIMPIREWQPYKRWDFTGRVIDKMKERGLRCTLITWLAFGSEARFYNNQKERLGHATGQDTPQKAIALAAALATGYVEDLTNLYQIAPAFTKREREIAAEHAVDIREKGRKCPDSQSKEDLLSAWRDLRYESTLQEQDRVIKELRLIDKKKNGEGTLLLEIRERLLARGGGACSWLTVTEEAILRSIEKWMENR